MIHITIFSGHDGQLQPDNRFYLTLFGGCDLIRPTVARQLLNERQMAASGRPSPHPPFFLTIFGGVDIKCPTLTEEFLDLREMINSGLLTMEDWDRSMAQLNRTGSTVASFTVFGGISEYELPTENEEVDSLAVQQHLGNISDSAGKVLQFGIGQRGSERVASLRRAFLTPA
jgi:hypothetical protein